MELVKIYPSISELRRQSDRTAINLQIKAFKDDCYVNDEKRSVKTTLFVQKEDEKFQVKKPYDFVTLHREWY